MTLTKSQTREIQKYMEDEAGDHVDWMTYEVNATTLAEDACDHFDAYVGPNYDIPEEFFEISQKVSDWYEVTFLKAGSRADSLDDYDHRELDEFLG